MARSVGWLSWRPPGVRVQREGVDKRRIVFVIFDGFQLLDLTGPHEVFQHASPLSAEYDCQVVSRTPGPVRSSSGLPGHASQGVGELDPAGSTRWSWRAGREWTWPGRTARSWTG
jgi:transcriptional regulator GlxA family with amidase domain